MRTVTTVANALEAYNAGFGPSVADVVAEAATRVPAFADRLAAHGLAPGRIRSVADLGALPVMTKDELIGQQRSRPPFGALLAEDARVRRIFQSPGPLYEPRLEPGEHWRFAQALRAAGFGPGDLVLNCFGYHLSPAGAIFEEAADAIGAAMVPAGVGGLDLQVQCIADLPVTAYTGLPSYLHTLVERYQAAGLDRDRWGMIRALVTAEPLPDDLRAALRPWVPDVLMAYGTAETGLLGYETAPGSALRLAAGVLVQVCDPATGEPVVDGDGEVVVTVLRPDYPLVRFGTGDLSAWTVGPDGDLRLAGVRGRVGRAVKVRGMFLHPTQAAAALDGTPGLAAYRFVVGRRAHVDQLSCEIVAVAGAATAALKAEVRERIRSRLRFDAEVRPVPSLPGDSAVLVDRRGPS